MQASVPLAYLPSPQLTQLGSAGGGSGMQRAAGAGRAYRGAVCVFRAGCAVERSDIFLVLSGSARDASIGTIEVGVASYALAV